VIFPPHVWVLKRELLWIPFVGWGLKLLAALAINRARVTRVNQVVEQASALRDGPQQLEPPADEGDPQQLSFEHPHVGGKINELRDGLPCKRYDCSSRCERPPGSDRGLRR